MRSNLRARVLYRLAATLAAIVPLLVVTAAPASAQSPSNDDISNAKVIATLPLRDTLDISQATWDFSTDFSSCSGSDHSVWYSFTPANSEQVAFDPSASNGLIAIDVFTGSPGALSFVGCGQGGFSGIYDSGFILNATGGTAYWIMASTVCCVPAPNLDLSVYLAVAPQATINVTGGTVDLGGNATITGTLDCVGTAPNGAAVTGSVRQSVGRLSSVSADFATTAPCARAQRWTALAQPSAGRFVGGPATVNATATVCNIVGCARPSTTAVITLRR
ncbi:MAG TPA: hypothetical protein VFD04_05170 [Actinomycetes bacterium]|jgi:hypothetical protein|nr:hypothetical protein [Actinomycetes bacterium]